MAVLPGLADSHIHLDKTLWGLPFEAHARGGTVAERIALERARRPALPPVYGRGMALARHIAALGTTRVRSHVDIDTQSGLSGLHDLLRLREALRDLLDIEIVAFPQSGILRDPGTAALMDAALREGADLVGGLDPAGIDGDPAAHLDIVFGLAARHGKGIDIHLHDPGAQGLAELEEIALRTVDGPLAAPAPQRRWHIPVAFGGNHGPQLAEVAELAGTREEEAVRQICAAELRVLAIGFAPGQPYIGLLPERWNFPRMSALNPEVPAGALTIAVRQIVMFTAASPTGWRQVGRAAFRNFLPGREPPVPLRAGDAIRYVPVSADEYETLAAAEDGLGGATLEVLG
ncbi:carboxyltransferase domain-containing protein [Mangrovicoccus ximenensis]|uniref:carboxyltransferase domain-containing protein n=1 Tax=Mangrovicoccus ximenensis TaxID=1911570 RepID=UPI001374B0B1|nr:carboxyltransferase domain-containing protein [Mangrovicoccus ximenensis]